MAPETKKPKRKSAKDAEASPLATNIIVIAVAIPLISIMSLYSLQNDIWVRGETYWLISRAAAVAAFLVLTLVVVLGLLLSHPRNKDTWRWTPYLLSWHQSLMAALFILIGLHLFFTLSDAKSGITVSQVWFPIHARYHPIAMVAGSFSVYGLLAVMVSLGLRKLTKLWLPLHRMSWMVWLLVFAHGILGGTDTARLQLLYWISAAVVAVTFYWRHWVNNQRRAARRSSTSSVGRSELAATGPENGRTSQPIVSESTVSTSKSSHSPVSQPRGGSI